MIRRSLATLLAFALLTGCTTLQDRAKGAAIADGATTLVGVALGAAEASPLGLATAVIKYPLLEYVKTLPVDEQAAFYASASAVWGGAAVNNVLVGAAIAAKVACGPWCLVAGIGYAIYDWRASAPERDFYAACAAYKQWSGETAPCVYRIEG